MTDGGYRGHDLGVFYRGGRHRPYQSGDAVRGGVNIRKSLLVLMAAVVVYVMCMSQVSAATGGLLNGKTMYHGTSLDATASTLVLTDNKNNTTVTTDINTSPTNPYYFIGRFADPVRLTRIYQGSTSPILIQLYNVSGDLLYQQSFTGFTGWAALNNAVDNVSMVAFVAFDYRVFAELDVDGVAQPDMTPPAVPATISATAVGNQVALAWSAVTASDLAGYHVYQGSTRLTTTPITATTYSVMSGLSYSTAYTFGVTSVDQSGNESAKRSTTVTTEAPPPDPPPAKPTGLTATLAGLTANLSWTANSESDLAGYNVYVGNTKLNGALLTGTSYTATGLVQGQTYSYTVTAVDQAGNESAKSDAKTVTVPVQLTAYFTPGKTQIVVSISGGSPPYSIDWGSGHETVTDLPYTITGLTAATDYVVSVTDAADDNVTQTVNTGNTQVIAPPVIPDPDTIYQRMLNSFGDAGTIAVVVIGGAVVLAILCVLALYGWRLTKRWLSTAR